MSFASAHYDYLDPDKHLHGDELRLAGNGVVPQCAAVAFRNLFERVITP